MHTTVTYEMTFEAAHLLPHVPAQHRCRRLHGHNYRVEFELSGPVDPHLGWVRDFGDIEAVAEPLVASIDHRLLNDIEGLDNPTAECIAAWFFERLVSRLPELCAVIVHENDRSRARVSRS